MKLLSLLFNAAFFAGSDLVDYARRKIRELSEAYVHSIKSMLIWTFIPSLALITLGIMTKSSTLIIFGGVWRAIWTFLLGLALAPVGLMLEMVTGGFAGSGKRYLEKIEGMFVAELVFTLIISVLPVWNNMKIFPIFVLAAIIMGLTGMFSAKSKAMGKIVFSIFICAAISFFLPSLFPTIGKKIDSIDSSIAKSGINMPALPSPREIYNKATNKPAGNPAEASKEMMRHAAPPPPAPKPVTAEKKEPELENYPQKNYSAPPESRRSKSDYYTKPQEDYPRRDYSNSREISRPPVQRKEVRTYYNRPQETAKAPETQQTQAARKNYYGKPGDPYYISEQALKEWTTDISEIEKEVKAKYGK